MNHAFLIMAHDSPELLRRIILRLAAPNHYFFVHIDKKSSCSKIDCTGLNAEYIPDDLRINTKHGGFSQVETEHLLLQMALESKVKFDYFHLISGHDYPLVSNKDFDEFFEKNNGDSFMHYDSPYEHSVWTGKYSDRINVWDFRELPLPHIMSRLLEIPMNLLFKRHFEPEIFAGWQWFSWHRKVAEFSEEFWEQNPDYVSRFRFTRYNDEIFYHTALKPYLKDLNIVTDNSLRYIDWHPKREYKTLPLVLDEQDYQQIIDSGMFFCRKVFLDESGKLLDMIDANLER